MTQKNQNEKRTPANLYNVITREKILSPTNILGFVRRTCVHVCVREMDARDETVLSGVVVVGVQRR